MDSRRRSCQPKTSHGGGICLLRCVFLCICHGLCVAQDVGQVSHDWPVSAETRMGMDSYVSQQRKGQADQMTPMYGLEDNDINYNGECAAEAMRWRNFIARLAQLRSCNGAAMVSSRETRSNEVMLPCWRRKWPQHWSDQIQRPASNEIMKMLTAA